MGDEFDPSDRDNFFIDYVTEFETEKPYHLSMWWLSNDNVWDILLVGAYRTREFAEEVINQLINYFNDPECHLNLPCS